MKIVKVLALVVMALLAVSGAYAQTSYGLYFWQLGNGKAGWKNNCSQNLVQYTNSTGSGSYGAGQICFAGKAGDPLTLELPYDPATGGGELLVDRCTNTEVNGSFWYLVGDTCKNANGDYISYTYPGVTFEKCTSKSAIVISNYSETWTDCVGRNHNGYSGFEIVVPADSPTRQGKYSWIFKQRPTVSDRE